MEDSSQIMISACTKHQQPCLQFGATEEVERYMHTVNIGHFSSASLVVVVVLH